MQAVEDLLDVPGAARYLGVSIRSIYRLVSEGSLPSYRVGRQLRFDRDELRAVLRRRTPRVSA